MLDLSKLDQEMVNMHAYMHRMFDAVDRIKKEIAVERFASTNKQSTPLVCDVCNCLSTPTNEVHPVNICFKCYEDAH